MKIIVISVILISSIFANKVFDITDNDYNKYLKNSDKMLDVFKNRFLYKKTIKKETVINKENNISKVDKILIAKNDRANKENNITKVDKILIAKSNSIKKEKVIIKDYSKKKVVKPIIKPIKNKLYSKKEILAKLNVSNIRKSKNLKKLTNSIENILEKQNTQYNIKDIKSIIKLINYNQLSQFESELYLKQIIEFIKGN